MKYTYNFWLRCWGRILYLYSWLWFPLLKVLPVNLNSKFYCFVLFQFGGYGRNPYYEITQYEKCQIEKEKILNALLENENENET